MIPVAEYIAAVGGFAIESRCLGVGILRRYGNADESNADAAIMSFI